MKKTEDPSAALPFEAAKPEEILPLLRSGISRSSRLQCWTPGRKFSYTSRIVKVHENGEMISISVSKELKGGAEFERSIMSDSVGEILFSLHLPTDVVFFKGEYRKGDADLFNVRVKTPVFKVQRREALRLPVPGAQQVTLRLGSGQVITASLVNLSEGGVAVSFKTRQAYEDLATAEAEVDLSFTAFGLSVSTKAILRHFSELPSTLSNKTYRAGFEFLDIKIETRTQLSQLVIEESAKYLGRF